ncbi:S41 family peptidase [Robertkochia sediminum]|uniref:S41 family peptidase n=1 Tax=Robertkochia sediminum TaxID=2785326 RepID=UPI0019338730|nr:S41 family peptidase [Robertkochia sediminum]MBL7473798.1 PDZ domain-containing protein [Robertkochia sediminum]
MRILLSLCLLLAGTAGYAQGTRLLRQPAMFGDQIVFVYANDLWKVNKQGGEAVRLTSDAGYESLPHFSPDGKHIAFTAEYGGNTDVYVIPSEGGSPQRLTWHPGGDFVQGWTPDGKVMFRSSREGVPTRLNRFYAVGISGGMPEALDIPRAAFGELSPDGAMAAYTPITFWDPEWRNYRGGQAMPVWILDMKTKALTRTPQKTGERHLDPVWYQGKVFYISERDLAANIWSYDPQTMTEQQHTFHKKFDVKSLDASPDGIVYEQGGYLHLLDVEGGNTTQLEVHVNGDMSFSRPRWEEISAAAIGTGNVSPTGQRGIFEYRGEVVTVPREHGSMRNLTNSPGVADRSPVWSPEGDEVAWFSDASGEYRLVIADQYGVVKKHIDIPKPTFYFEPAWAPGGKHIAFTDTDYRVWLADVTAGTAKTIDADRYAHPNRTMNPVWSPDGKWITYVKQLESHFKAVFAYHTDTGKVLQLTDGMADCISPVWDANGKYLYFLGSTDYGLNSGWLDMSSYDPSVSRNLYCLVLSAEDASPVPLRSDDETVTKPAEKEDSKKKKKKKDEDKTEATVKVVIDAEGLWQRIIPLKPETAAYTSLEAGEDLQLLLAEEIEGARGYKVHHYKVDEEELEDFAEGVNFMRVTADRKKVLMRQGGKWAIYNSKGNTKNDKEAALDFNKSIKVDPKEEYHQIFKEGWRFMRDFLYVDNVHGAPWDAVYEWYAPWIDHVRHRTDLNYVVDIMSGEVSIGHSYVSGGDMPDLDRVPVGLLGADLEVANGHYRIGKIYSGEMWNPGLEAPLSVPGLKVSEGDYIFSVNGRTLDTGVNPYSLFEQTAGELVTLEVGSKSDGSDKRSVTVKPVSSERQLRSVAWVEANRRKVDELSGGKLAYVYVPNTSGQGFTSFNRYYFAQQDKKGVVIDERNNGGGSAADYMIDIMSRQHFGYFNSKTGDHRPWTTPMAGIWGPKVMLINERAGSGGDLLPYMFREAKLGPLVGTRTWGGLVGTWDTPRFIDGGRMVAPRGGFYDVKGEWAVEGEGVAPDIEVIQEPSALLEGRDPQLERGVQEALKLLETEAFELLPEPKAPVRWKRPEGFKNDK